MTENHNKSDPQEANPYLQALRSARGERGHAEKRLKKELETLFQGHVERYLEFLDLPTKITEAVNSGKTAVEVDIKSATTFFENKLSIEGTFCEVKNPDLNLSFAKTWTQFYQTLLRQVAVGELSNSKLIASAYTNKDSRHGLWNPNETFILSGDVPETSITFERNWENRVVRPHAFKKNRYTHRCLYCELSEIHRVHNVAAAYPVILELDWR